MAERRAGLRLGLFVATALIGLTGLGIFFGGTPNFLTNRVKYTLVFTETPGVSLGTPVRKSGVRIGDVTELNLDETTGKVRVQIQVDKKFLPRQGDEPTISRGILSGDTAIDFVPKADTVAVVDRSAIVPPGSDIPGVAPFNTRVLLNQVGGVLPNAQESLAQILATFRRFEQIAPKLERTLDDFSALARSGREAIPEFRRTNDKVQELLGANEDTPPTLKAMIQDIRDAVKSIKPLAEDLHQFVDANKGDASAAVTAVRTTAERLNELLNADNRKNVSLLVKNLSGASDDLGKTVKLVAIFLDTADQTLKELKSRLKNAEVTLNNIQQATKPLADNSAEIIRNVAVATDQLARTLADIRELVRLAGKPDGTLQKVVSDPALYNNLVETTAGLARTVQRAEKIARDLEVFADKVARRPEVLGVGGALRPNTGLKESPYAPTPVDPPSTVGPLLAPIPPVPGGVTSYKPGAWENLLGSPPKR
ncbi:MAG TPA: MlaD family protein [Fimbriiglobus sp.]|jgi:phospholipid/cholesterol/gamma-HCH transport system substrate-binding protein